MGLYDLFTIGVAVTGYLIGRHRGLVWQISGIGTLIIGGLCATILCRPLGSFFADGIVGRFAAWVVLYAVVAICLYVITLKLKDKIKELEFDELDKRFGGMLGSFKALLAFSVVTLIAVAISSGVRGAVKASATGRTLSYLVHELRPLVPEKIHDAFGPYLDPTADPHATRPSQPQPATPRPATPTQPTRQPPPRRPIQRPPAQRPPVQRQPARRPPLSREPVAPLEPPTPEPATREPAREPAPDPFDTGDDPRDPLAPDE